MLVKVASVGKLLRPRESRCRLPESPGIRKGVCGSKQVEDRIRVANEAERTVLGPRAGRCCRPDRFARSSRGGPPSRARRTTREFSSRNTPVAPLDRSRLAPFAAEESGNPSRQFDSSAPGRTARLARGERAAPVRPSWSTSRPPRRLEIDVDAPAAPLSAQPPEPPMPSATYPLATSSPLFAPLPSPPRPSPTARPGPRRPFRTLGRPTAPYPRAASQAVCRGFESRRPLQYARHMAAVWAAHAGILR